jgi:hypothetical protein
MTTSDYSKHKDFFPKEMLLGLVVTHAEADGKYEERSLRLKKALNVEGWNQYEVSRE